MVDAIGPKMEPGRTLKSPRHNNPNFRSGRVTRMVTLLCKLRERESVPWKRQIPFWNEFFYFYSNSSGRYFFPLYFTIYPFGDDTGSVSSAYWVWVRVWGARLGEGCTYLQEHLKNLLSGVWLEYLISDDLMMRLGI